MNKEKIQVLMSTYNGEKYIDEQINSILNQTYKNIEVIIRDDGSTDDTFLILEKYRNNPQIKIYTEENIGVVGSFFELLNKVDKESKYFAFCDQDDVWEKEKIKQAIYKIEESCTDSNVPIVYGSRVRPVSENLEVVFKNRIGIETDHSFYNSLVENVIPGCTAVFNKIALEYMQKANNTQNIIMHDKWLYMIGVAFGKVICDERSFILYRQHSNNVLGGKRDSLSKIKRKVSQLNNKKIKHRIYKDAVYFREIYGVELSDKNLIKLDKFIQSQYKITYRILLVLRNDIYIQDKIDNVIFKMLFILNLV